MKSRFYVGLIGLGLLVGLIAGCDSLGDDGGIAQLSGQVVDAVTGAPISEAKVEVVFTERSDASTRTLVTDLSGLYALDVEVDSISNIVLYASHDGYREEEVKILAVPDHEVEIPVLRLQPASAGKAPGEGGSLPDNSGGSGSAASITLTSLSTSDISVIQSGFVETAQFVFAVLDSNGVPVDADHAADVRLSIAAGPDGGEFVSPASATTNAKGLVEFNFTSGTTAGAVQLLAEVTVDGRTIRSKPTQIAIHGGLPDQAHFAAGPTSFNFPAWGILGATLNVTAYAGDKYGNPVRPGTIVYFTTTGGIIDGSATTDGAGAAGVNLISNRPFPVHPTLGEGYATVTATTADENGQTVSDEFQVLFSGAANIEVAPYESLELGGLYRFFVYDQHENPLASGTSISVSVEGENVKVIGDTDVSLDDALFGGPKITEFQFTIAQVSSEPDEEGNLPATTIDAVKIEVSGPNGNTGRTLLASGTVFRMGD